MFEPITTINFISSYVPLLILIRIQSVISDSENLSHRTFTDEEFNAKTLISLNNYRKLHGVPPLEFNSQLAENAAKWAIKLQDKASNEGKLRAFFSHPHVEGENVMVRENDSVPIDGSDAVHHWYSEIEKYDFSKHLFLYETAQFTQLVWKETKNFGMAMVHNSVTNSTVVVARFTPPGNIGMASSFKENVLPLLTGVVHKKLQSSNTTTSPEHTSVATPQTGIKNKSQSLDLVHRLVNPKVGTAGTIEEAVSKPKSTAKTGRYSDVKNIKKLVVLQPNENPIPKSKSEVVTKPNSLRTETAGRSLEKLVSIPKATSELKSKSVEKSMQAKSVVVAVHEIETEITTEMSIDMTPSTDEELETDSTGAENVVSSAESSEVESDSSTTSEPEIDATTTETPSVTEAQIQTIDKQSDTEPTSPKKHEHHGRTVDNKDVPKPTTTKNLDPHGLKIDKKSKSKPPTKPHVQGRAGPNPKPKSAGPAVSSKKDTISKLEVTSESSIIESDSEEVIPQQHSSLSSEADPDEETIEITTESSEMVEDVTTATSVEPEKLEVPPDQMKFAQDGLIAHNKYRKLHGVPPLKLDPQLVYDSYEWAKINVANCDSKPKCVLTNTKRQDRGENIYAVKGISRMTGTKAVDYWYKEIQQYNWTKPGYQWKAGHFTAIVWKNSKSMGMAWVKGKKGIYVAVAQYYPPGNVAYSRFFQTNVLPIVPTR